jgi:hypothetical protein
MSDTVPAGIDTSKPNIARIYDYWLGGKDNFAVDRQQAERSLELCPGLSRWARDNRAFVCGAAARAAREAADASGGARGSTRGRLGRAGGVRGL